MKRATAIAVSLLAASTASAQAPETGTFTLQQFGTTIATETFRRTPTSLETDLTIPSEATVRTSSTLNRDGTLARLEVRVLPPGGEGAPLQSTGVAFSGARATPERPIGNALAPMDVPTGTVAYVNPSPSFMEQILRRARAVGGDSVTVPILTPGAGGLQVVEATVVFAADAATLTLGGVAVQAVTDEVGRFLSGTVPSQGLVISRR